MKLPSPGLPASSLQILSMLMRLSPLLLMVFSLLYSCILFGLLFILICSRWGSGEQKEFFPLQASLKVKIFALGFTTWTENADFMWLLMAMYRGRWCWTVTLFRYKTAGNKKLVNKLPLSCDRKKAVWSWKGKLKSTTSAAFTITFLYLCFIKINRLHEFQ